MAKKDKPAWGTGVGVGVEIVLGGATIMDPLASPESLNHPNGQSRLMKVRMPATAPRNTIVLTTLANTDLGINRFIPSIPRVFRRPRKPTHTATRLLNLYLSPGIWVINDLNAEVPLSHLSINGYIRNNRCSGFPSRTKPSSPGTIRRCRLELPSTLRLSWRRGNRHQC